MKKQLFKNQTNSIMKLERLFCACTLSMFLFTSCNNELTDQKDSISVKGSKVWIQPYTFNWEDPNLNWMPYPSGGSVAPIPLPWNGQGSLSSTLDPDVLNDRKASDGWVLLYSTFSPTILTYNPYFILYNRYRGLMRIFMYVNNSSFGSSSYLKNAITQPTNQYKILNFAGSEVVDVSTNQTKVTKIEPVPVDGSSPFATFKWYMLQYELAYDPNIVATTSVNPPQLSFNINSVDITQVNLGGEVTGTLKGAVGATGPSDIFSNITSQIKPLGTGVLAAVGNSALSKFATTGDKNNSLGLSNGLFTSISSGLTSLVTKATNSIPGTVVSILSGIIGGSSGSAGQTVSLNLKADISLAGTMTNTTALPSTPASFYFPGSLLADGNGNYNVQGYVPLYNKPLGVFNLSAKPTVTLDYICFPNFGRYCQLYKYYLDNNSFNIQWNPDVLENATIQHLTKEVIIRTNSSNISSYLTNQSGRVETIQGSYNWWTGSDGFQALFTTPDTYKPVHFGGEIYLRISFVVHPNNGAPDVAIVKTFNVNQRIINPTY